jgi:hypothetical protein
MNRNIIKQKLLNVQGVRSVELIGGHGWFEAIVDGGHPLEIAEALAEVRPAGTETRGTVQATIGLYSDMTTKIAEIDGCANKRQMMDASVVPYEYETIHFSRPSLWYRFLDLPRRFRDWIIDQIIKKALGL